MMKMKLILMVTLVSLALGSILLPSEGNYDFGDTDSIEELVEEEFEIHEAVYIQFCSVVQH